jgi:hypothetical protein
MFGLSLEIVLSVLGYGFSLFGVYLEIVRRIDRVTHKKELLHDKVTVLVDRLIRHENDTKESLKTLHTNFNDLSKSLNDLLLKFAVLQETLKHTK